MADNFSIPVSGGFKIWSFLSSDAPNSTDLTIFIKASSDAFQAPALPAHLTSFSRRALVWPIGWAKEGPNNHTLSFRWSSRYLMGHSQPIRNRQRVIPKVLLENNHSRHVFISNRLAPPETSLPWVAVSNVCVCLGAKLTLFLSWLPLLESAKEVQPNFWNQHVPSNICFHPDFLFKL